MTLAPSGWMALKRLPGGPDLPTKALRAWVAPDDTLASMSSAAHLEPSVTKAFWMQMPLRSISSLVRCLHIKRKQFCHLANSILFAVAVALHHRAQEEPDAAEFDRLAALRPLYQAE